MHLLWDQGTLLLRGAESASALPGVLWDPRVGAWRAPAFKYEEIRLVATSSNTPLRDTALALLPSPGPLTVTDLRPYQEAALMAWELAAGRGVVALPTGAGKTRTAIAAIARTRSPTLILVPTRVLVQQWMGALRQSGAAEVGQVGDGEHRLGSITISTFASATRHMADLGNRFGLLIVDEAHHFGGRADEPLEMCAAPLRLGLTATPPEGPHLDRLSTLLGPVVYRAAIEQLAGRFLAPFRLVTLSLPLSSAERVAWENECNLWRPTVRRFFTMTPEASWPDFVHAAGQSDEGRRVLGSWRRARAMLRLTQAKADVVGRLLDRHVQNRVLVFGPDAETAIELSRQQLIPAITADIGRAERNGVLERFAQGALRALASARVLNEGVDVPAADVALILGGGLSDRAYVQRIGRVLRPEPGKEAIIYELVVEGTGELAAVEQRRRALASA